MKKEFHQLGREFDEDGINEATLPEMPHQLFEQWFQNHLKTKPEDPTAMNLATIGLNGYPEARIVLMKEFSSEGITFFTNYKSKKGVSIAMDNKVCLSFYWKEPARQIRIEGKAVKISEKDSDRYFKSRPFQSQVGAVVSPQSEVIPSREFLEEKYHKTANSFNEESLMRPKDWGGYIVKPVSYEFWQGRASRLHDRIFYTYASNKWKISRLAP